MLSDNLKRIREEQGYSKMQLAKISNVSRRTIMLIETKKTTSPGIETLRRLAKALNIDIEDLIK